MVWYEVALHWKEKDMVWGFHPEIPWNGYGAVYHPPEWVPLRNPESNNWTTSWVPKNGWLKCTYLKRNFTALLGFLTNHVQFVGKESDRRMMKLITFLGGSPVINLPSFVWDLEVHRTIVPPMHCCKSCTNLSFCALIITNGSMVASAISPFWKNWTTS